MNILVVSAHHDDLELGCGGTVAKLISEGHAVTSLVMTNSGYQDPDQKPIRAKSEALEEAKMASQTLGYALVSYDEDTLDIPVSDENIVKILRTIKEREIDTILTHWHGDSHPPHKRVNTMVLHASRQVPRVLGFAVHWYLGEEPFAPNFFVPIDDAHWDQKIKALGCYQSEFKRTGTKWVDYQDHQTRLFGTQFGVSRAEGFVVYKYLWT
jgi:LmbE family N-acetylglucosaminyl deacetylase